MMYKKHYIRVLAQSARLPAALYMGLETINGTDKRTDHPDKRATRFAHALSHLVHRTRVARSF